ncbi:hypothetical protein D3C77_171160 [compost metagenome]
MALARVLALEQVGHVRRVTPIGDFSHGNRPAAPEHVHHGAHLQPVKVHANQQRLTLTFHLVAVIQPTVEVGIDSAGCEVDELATQVSPDQLWRIGVLQGRDIVIRQIRLIVVGAGLDQAVQRLQLWPLADLLYELLVGELEPFRCRGNIHAILQAVHLVAHPRNDLPPGLLGFELGHYIQLVDQGMTDLEADDGCGLLHRPADHRAAVLPTTVEVDLFVRLLDLDAQPPIEGHLFDRWEENVPDLRVRGSEVASVDARPLPNVLAEPGATYPGLP